MIESRFESLTGWVVGPACEREAWILAEATVTMKDQPVRPNNERNEIWVTGFSADNSTPTKSYT